MKQWRLVGIVAIFGILGAGIVAGGSAGADPSSGATLTFSSTQQLVLMDIPAGSCPSGGSTCTWMLYVNEPGRSGQPAVASVTGTSGTLSVPYPPDFCGVIQADALVGPGNWVYQTGARESIHTCPGPVVPPNGGGGSTPTGGGTQSTTNSSTTYTSTVNDPTTFTSATSAGTSSATTAATTLPFTGVDISPLLLAGLAAVAIGVILVAEPRSVRRLRWLTETGAARQLGSILDWFIGH